MKYTLLVTSLFCLISQAAVAQSSTEPPELDSDRPNFTQAATVIPQRTLQLETGLGYEKEKSDNEQTRNYLYPTTLIRVGILKKAELRINFDFEQENQTLTSKPGATISEAKERGFDNVQIGTKIALVEAKGVIPDIGVLASLSLPVGLKEYRPPHAAPSIQMLFNSHFSDKVELQYNFGYRKHKEETDYLVQLLYSASAIVHLTENLQGFAEFQAFKTHQQAAENSIAGGFMFKLVPNLQFDILGGVGVSEKAPDYYTAAGVTWRVPH
ncbi:transporter [Adhaeribacter pallidiroseus]|uniref:Transporter n=1 Tax=Adhaeribacter pallidiroseus TaxID=2072847 RepID=A0A369Q9X2_9BACT|nr:transporter [Adhaeribacter pallidiroseus]RDC61693.1 hypothetical protein AHMF7616_00273 [Adhaeribacter pallidiroseus]